MALPTYNKSQRRQSFEQLPKAAYVVEIKSAKEEKNKKDDGSHLTIFFDIAEGEYQNYYRKRYDSNKNEDKKWPNDGVFYLTVPSAGCQEYVLTNWNTFFADLEDSNNGFEFGGDVKTLKGKLIGAKMCIEQSEYNGRIYDHTKWKWTCVAEDVRHGKAGQLPNDKLIQQSASPSSGSGWTSMAQIPDDDLPFS